MGLFGKLVEFFKDAVGIMDDAGDFLDWAKDKSREVENVMSVVEQDSRLISQTLRELELAQKNKDVFMRKQAEKTLKQLDKHLKDIDTKNIRRDMVEVITESVDHIRKLEKIRRNRLAKFGDDSAVQDIDLAVQQVMAVRKRFAAALEKNSKALSLLEELRDKQRKAGFKTAAKGAGVAVAGIVGAAVAFGITDLIVSGGKNVDKAIALFNSGKKDIQSAEKVAEARSKIDDAIKKLGASKEKVDKFDRSFSSYAVADDLSDELKVKFYLKKKDEGAGYYKLTKFFSALDKYATKGGMDFKDKHVEAGIDSLSASDVARAYVMDNVSKVTKLISAWEQEVQEWVDSSASYILGVIKVGSAETREDLNKRFSAFLRRHRKPEWAMALFLAVSRKSNSVLSDLVERHLAKVRKEETDRKREERARELMREAQQQARQEAREQERDAISGVDMNELLDLLD